MRLACRSYAAILLLCFSVLGGVLAATGQRHPAAAAEGPNSKAIPLGAVPGGLPRAEVRAEVEALTALGREIFRDPSLSASGRLACASCHDPDHAFGPANADPVQSGGDDMRQPGRRAVPSLKYLQAVPQFTEHFFESDDEGDESVDNGPTGGLTWDGRFDRLRDQVRLPLTSPYEMANASPVDFLSRLGKASYAGKLRELFGESVLVDPETAFLAVGKALEAYQQDYREFYPYSSKYDAYLAGRAELTPAERRGLALFNDPAKGNCASCHVSERGRDGTPPQFTDYGFIALGVPRNRSIPANADPGYHDLGLCGPERTDFSDRSEYCGLFKTPSLRNVATRKVFFHNGVVHSLRDAVAFYVERDTRPDRWYPRSVDGRVLKFDDLPQQYWANVNTDPPFGGHPGDRPPLSDAEIDDVVAFLKTLTDGYRSSP